MKKTGYIRWESILQFSSINLVKAGFIKKNRKNGTWYITEEGEKVFYKGKNEIFNLAQVKYKQDTRATSKEIQQLKGTLTGNDIGVFISLAGFSSDAKTISRSLYPHIELIDLNRFIELWQEFYSKMTDEDKALMQITPVYFIAEN